MAEKSLNKVMLIGRLGRDPEVKYMPSGTAVANFTLATSRQWTGKEGKQEEQTDWHRIVAFGKIAEIFGEYLNKGSRVYIEGRLQTREWTDQNGQKRYTTEIVVQDFMFLSGKGEAVSLPKEEIVYDEQPAGGKGGSEDDIPF